MYLRYPVALLLMLIIVQIEARAQDYLFEDFENGIPTSWKEEKLVSTGNWTVQNGGIDSEHPDTAYSGKFNAFFQYDGSSKSTRLITKTIDLSESNKPELRFALSNSLYIGVDELYVDGRSHNDSSWTTLHHYSSEISGWVYESYPIPDSLASSTFTLGFRAVTHWGGGVCLDDVEVIETGVVPYKIKGIQAKTPPNEYIVTGTQNNRILRVDFKVSGNTGTIELDKIGFNSKNTDDSDIQDQGVKIVYTPDTTFNNTVMIGQPGNFTGGELVFDSLNHPLQYGMQSIWLIYDMMDDPNHIRQGNTVDASISAGNIIINGQSYPSSKLDPPGAFQIHEAIFYDEFESSTGWDLAGEFQIDTPQGLGKRAYAYPDPENAYSGQQVLGTDLTGLNAYAGVYEPDLSMHRDSAVSPGINLQYYKDVSVIFNRWMNMDLFDDAYIHYSTDNRQSYQQLWENNHSVTDNSWKLKRYPIPESAKGDKINIRFSIGPTDDSKNASGWNIDNFGVIGDFISKDAGVSEWISPTDGCGHGPNEQVQVRITNYAGKPTPDKIPLQYSIDGGTNIIRDTLNQSLAVGESAVFTFSESIDLSTPGTYDQVWAQTALPGDEVASNNKNDTVWYIDPTMYLPYNENFDNSSGYWKYYGPTSTWEWGEPTGDYIHAPGESVWATDLDGHYLFNDSSYIESPCFSINDKQNVLFEAKLFTQFEKDTDGMNIYYSADNGPWQLFPKSQVYSKNWYNNDYLSALDAPGWDSTSTGWYRVQNLLPPDLSQASTVTFRIYIKSNNTINYEGAAINHIRILEAPQDVGVSQIKYPTTSCELSDSVQTEVYVTNNGIDTLLAGQEIPLGMKVNGNQMIKDTLNLTSDLIPEDSVLFTFTQTVNMADSGDYTFVVYTALEDNPTFYDNTSNDTVKKTISVQGMPHYDIGGVIGVEGTIDTTLDAGPGFSSYNWSTGATTQTINVTSGGWYKVTVTNNVACTATDSAKVVNSNTNTAVTDILNSLNDTCTRPDPVDLTIKITNEGLQGFQSGDTIPVAYQINGQLPVHDSLVLTSSLNNGESVNFSFSRGIDMSGAGNYTLQAYTNFPEDYNHSNDTIQTAVTTFGTTDTELKYDTLLTSQADSLMLDAGSSFDTYSYLWQDGSTGQTYDITHNRSAWYKVTVTSSNGCGSDADSSRIIATNLAVTSLTEPVSSCEFTTPQQAVVSLKNSSSDTLQANTSIPVVLIVDGQTHRDTIVPKRTLIPGDARDFTLSPSFDLSQVGTHDFTIYPETFFDVNRSNDTLSTTVETWGYPDVELLRDTIYTTQADTIELYAGEFATYQWQDNSANSTFQVTDNFSKQYSVTVTNGVGCGEDSDSVQIFTYNMGVKEMVAPSASCELSDSEEITVMVKNYSQDTLRPGDTMDIAVVMNETDTIRDTKTFSSKLSPNATFNHTFSQSVDMSAFTTYRFEFFTDHPWDADRSNDSLEQSVKTYGYPQFSLNYDTLYTTQPDTVALYPDIQGTAYLWSTGSNNQTLFVSDRSTANYSLTVTDINGCSWQDSTQIYTYDLALQNFTGSGDQCEFSSSETFTVDVKNNGYDTLQSGREIPLTYRFNGESAETETITLDSPLMPDSSISHTFAQTFDLSSQGSYDFTTSIDIQHDADASNDTLFQKIDYTGYPLIDLGPDTLFTQQPDTLVLDAGSGFSSYLWQDGSTSQTYNVTSNDNMLYTVEVTNSQGCTTRDSMLIVTCDLEMLAITSPANSCSFTEQEQVTVEVKNTSAGPVASETQLPLTLVSPQGTHYTETLVLSSPLAGGDTIEHTFTQPLNLSANHTYEIKAFVSTEPDIITSNDTAYRTIKTYDPPQPDLGRDTTVNARQYKLNPGSYSQYEWHDGNQQQTFTVNPNNLTSNDLYYVTVTDQNGCQGSDTVQVVLNITDIKLSELLNPSIVCDASQYEQVEFTLANSGTVAIPNNTKMPVGYQLGNANAINDTVTLTEDLQPDETINHTFDEKIDLQSLESFTLSLSVELEGDMKQGNNDTTATFQIYPSPQVDLGEDTMQTELPFTLDPGTYESYEWQDNTTSSTFEVTQGGKYSVTVTNQHGCTASDEIIILTTGLNDQASQQGDFQANIYPVPADEHLMIDLSSPKQRHFAIKLIGTQGYPVYTDEVQMREGTIRIHTQNLPRGIYYLRIEEENGMRAYKVILQ